MPSPKKVLDIIPIKDFGSKIRAIEPKLKPKPKREPIKIPILKISLVLLVMLSIGGVLTLHFVFQRATITIWPDTEEIRLTETIVVATEIEEINVEEKKIPGVALSFEKKITQLFDATGSEENATKSQGSIRIFNERPVVQILIINTRFISEDGFLFRSTKRIEIPAGSANEPGFLDVAVVAVEAGPSYNISPSNFSVPGLAGSSLYTKVYGESELAMAGGFSGETTVVSRADIDGAEESLIATATVRIKRELRAQLPGGFIVPDDGFSIDVVESSSAVKSGAALSQFNYSVTLVAEAIAFTTADLEQLSRTLLAAVAEEGKSVNAQTFQIEYKVKDLNIKNGILGMDVTSLADSYFLADTGGFAELVGGITPLTAEALLKGEEGVGETKVDLWPFWLTKIPMSQDKIEIRINVD